MSDIATVIAAVGGAGVTAVFDDPTLFGWYAIGLAIGFAAYFVVGMRVSAKAGTDPVNQWMGD